MVYTRSFLKTLKRKALAKLDQYPGLFDRDAMLAARTMHAFDNAVTAPLHGFCDTDDYWTRATTRALFAAHRHSNAASERPQRSVSAPGGCRRRL